MFESRKHPAWEKDVGWEARPVSPFQGFCLLYIHWKLIRLCPQSNQMDLGICLPQPTDSNVNLLWQHSHRHIQEQYFASFNPIKLTLSIHHQTYQASKCFCGISKVKGLHKKSQAFDLLPCFKFVELNTRIENTKLSGNILPVKS